MLGRGLVPIRESGKRASSSKKACGGQAFGRWKLARVVGPWKGCMSIDSVPVDLGSLVQSPCNGERPIPLFEGRCLRSITDPVVPRTASDATLEPRAFFCRFEIGAIQQRDQHPNRQGSGAEAKLEGQKIGPKVAIMSRLQTETCQRNVSAHRKVGTDRTGVAGKSKCSTQRKSIFQPRNGQDLFPGRGSRGHVTSHLDFRLDSTSGRCRDCPTTSHASAKKWSLASLSISPRPTQMGGLHCCALARPRRPP